MNKPLSGNEAVAYALKQINPDVMGAFPITPSTEIPEYFAQYVADGEVDTEYVTVGQSTAQCPCALRRRLQNPSVSATSSCRLALMYEMLYVAASCRLPITLACVNRALSGPININNDHSDSMGAYGIAVGSRSMLKIIRRPTIICSWPCRSARHQVYACR